MPSSEEVKKLLAQEGYDAGKTMRDAQKSAKQLPTIKGEATKVGVALYMIFPSDKEGKSVTELYKEPPEIMVVDVVKGRSLGGSGATEKIYLELDDKVIYDNRDYSQKASNQRGNPFKTLVLAAKAPNGQLTTAIMYLSMSNLKWLDAVQKELSAVGKTFVDSVIRITPVVMCKAGVSDWAGLKMEVAKDADDKWLEAFTNAFKEAKARKELYNSGSNASMQEHEESPTAYGNTV